MSSWTGTQRRDTADVQKAAVPRAAMAEDAKDE